MGITKSYFGTKYNLSAYDFEWAERKEAGHQLAQHWLKNKELVSFASEFLIEDETAAHLMPLLAEVFFHEKLQIDLPDLPSVATARETGFRYRTTYDSCRSPSRFEFAQAAFLMSRIRFDKKPELRNEWARRSEADTQVWAMADFLYGFHQKSISIYSETCQAEFRTLFRE